MRPWSDHLPGAGTLNAADLGAGGTLLRRWAALAVDRPEAPLWLEPQDHSADGAGRGWCTAGQFEQTTRRSAERLAGAGLVPGDRVLWSTGSSITALSAHVGALRAGLVVVPVNTAYSEREVAYIVGDVRPAAAIVERSDQVAWIDRATAGGIPVFGPELGPVLGACPAGPGPVGELRIDAAGPDDPALIGYTSGTTGAPKGAVLRHRNLLAATEAVRRAWRWDPGDRLIHALPVFHAHGLCVGVYGTLSAGASAVLLPAFDPAMVVDLAATHRASLYFGVPTMYHRLLRSGRAPELGRLRLCVSGSAPLSAALHTELAAVTGSAVLERYGMTETLMNVSNPYEGERRAGTVGFPLPGVEVRLADDEEIQVRGPNVFDGYWERPSATADAFEAEDAGRPWFRTGDLGVEDDGYLVIRGRSKELIISGGFNVYPSEVEDVLGRHPGIVEVAVTGTASDEWGEVVTAWIVADGTPPTAEELTAFTASMLAPYKRPRLVRVIDRLPRNALGKVVRSQLG